MLCTKKNLCLIVYASVYYWFQTNMQTFALKILQDKEFFQGKENFPIYGSPGIKLCRNICRNPGLNWIWKQRSHAVYHKTIGVRK